VEKAVFIVFKLQSRNLFGQAEKNYAIHSVGQALKNWSFPKKKKKLKELLWHRVFSKLHLVWQEEQGALTS
jgi:hypothetical protein